MEAASTRVPVKIARTAPAYSLLAQVSFLTLICWSNLPTAAHNSASGLSWG